MKILELQPGETHVEQASGARSVGVALRWLDWKHADGLVARVRADVSFDNGASWEFGGRGGVFPISFDVTGKGEKPERSFVKAELPGDCLVRVTVSASQKMRAVLEVECA